MLNYFTPHAIITIKRGDNYMLQLYKNIKQRRLELGMNQSELAEKMGYADKSMIAKIEKGLVDLPQSKILAIAECLNIAPGELMGWEDDNNTLPSNIVPLTKTKTKKVPLIGTIACGVPILAVQNIEEYIDMDSEIHADFALRCKGDSMINARIFDGDIVYIKEQPNIENGEIAAVVINNIEAEATLKRVYIDNEKIRLCAENPLVKDMVFFHEDMNNVRILGKAVAFLSAVR